MFKKLCEGCFCKKVAQSILQEGEKGLKKKAVMNYFVTCVFRFKIYFYIVSCTFIYICLSNFVVGEVCIFVIHCYLNIFDFIDDILKIIC